MAKKHRIDSKKVLTRVFLCEAGLKHTDFAVKQHMKVMWNDHRDQGLNHLRLTQQGFDFLKNQVNLKSYEIQFDPNTTFTNNLILWLEKYLDTPYFISGNIINVFRERTAVELMMLDGNIYRLGEIKHLNDPTNLVKTSIDD